jgi:hypothetical protein
LKYVGDYFLQLRKNPALKKYKQHFQNTTESSDALGSIDPILSKFLIVVFQINNFQAA